MKIRMSVKEEELFRGFASAASAYFEYGIGGSTILAGELVKGPVVAVDSDLKWVIRARQSMPPSVYRRTLEYIDIGPTGAWGYPTNFDHQQKYENYFTAIKSFAPTDMDLCLIDGRFRVACFLQSMKYLRYDAVIAIHDYRSRKHFHVAERFGRIIAETGDITFFVKRLPVDIGAIESMLIQYGKITQ